LSGWWAGKVRQAWRYVTGRIGPAEREGLRGWLTGPQLDLFDASGERGSRNYWTAYNGVSRVLRQLELRIKATAGDDDDPVRRYVEAVHGNGGGA